MTAGADAARAPARSWPVYVAGAMVVLASVAHIPAAWEALNYFDPPKRLLWAVLAVCLALAGVVRRSRMGSGSLWWAVGLMGWMGLRGIFRPVPDAELEVLFTWILPLLMLVLASGLPRGPGRRFLGWCLVLSGVFQAGLMLLQRTGLDPVFFETTATMAYAPGRMVGTIGYHNQAVDFLALAGSGIFILARGPLARMGLLLPLVGVAVLTGNRGGILAFAVAVFISQIVAIGLQGASIRRSRWRMALATALILVAGAAAVLLVPETRSRFLEAARGFQGSPAARSRLYMARIGLDMWREKPWVGWGAGEYALQYLDRLGAILPADKTHDVLRGIVFAREAHNDGIQLAAEFGIIGLALLAGLLATGGACWIRRRRDEADAAVAAAYVVTFMLVSGLVSFPWQTSMAGPLAGFLLGWWWPARRGAPAISGGGAGIQRKGLGPSPAAIFLLAASLILSGWFGWDYRLNLAIPSRVSASDVDSARDALPRFGYRYRALVGAAYAAGGALAEAERELFVAEQGYRDVLLWNNLAHVRAGREKWNDAVALYERWVRCGLDHSNALVNCSLAYEQVGRWADARAMLSQKCFLFPAASLAELRRLAVLYLKAGNPTAARNLLESRFDKWERADDHQIAEFLNLIGASCLAEGDRQQAAQWFRAALAYHPGLESARQNLEVLLPGSEARPLEP